MGTSVLRIKSEVECKVFLFDEEKGIATPDKYFNLEVRKGEQELLFVSTINEKKQYRLCYLVEDNDCDYKINIIEAYFTIQTEKNVDQKEIYGFRKVDNIELASDYNNINDEDLVWIDKDGSMTEQFNVNYQKKGVNSDGIWVDPEWIYLYRAGCECAEKEDWEEAAKYFLSAAEMGYSEAQYEIGNCYSKGNGVKQNLEQAKSWFLRAAKEGYALAQCSIGSYYEGENAPVEALKWYLKVLENKDEKAKRISLERIERIKHKIKSDMGHANQSNGMEMLKLCHLELLKQTNSDIPDELQDINSLMSEINKTTPYYLFFDTETTGVPNDYNLPASNTKNWPRIVQLGWLLTNEKGDELLFGNEIIKPDGFIIPNEAARVHGITTEKALREGKPLLDVIRKFIADARFAKRFVGHNLAFDKNVVGAELHRLGIKDSISIVKGMCTMIGSTKYCKIPSANIGYKPPKLQELYKKLFGTSFDNAHDAMADVKATKKCFFELKRLGYLDYLNC